MNDSDYCPVNIGCLNTQNAKIVSFLKNSEATRYMLATNLDIPIQSVCRRVDFLLTNQQVAVVKKDYCKVSGRLAEYLTSKTEQIQSFNRQLKFL